MDKLPGHVVMQLKDTRGDQWQISLTEPTI